MWSSYVIQKSDIARSRCCLLHGRMDTVLEEDVGRDEKFYVLNVVEQSFMVVVRF